MKRKITTLTLLLFAAALLRAQGPTLNLVGTSPTFSKGNINVEVLSEIIQQKQDEVRKMVFRNTIIDGFNKASFASNFRNFTTFHFLYNLMEVMTSGKNKTAITKAIIENSAEFAFVYGLALYVHEAKTSLLISERSVTADMFFTRTTRTVEEETSSGNKLSNKPEMFQINLLLDICYDAALKNEKVQKKFKFKSNLEDTHFKTWYETDNCFLAALREADTLIKSDGKTGDWGLLITLNLLNGDSVKGKNWVEKRAMLENVVSNLKQVRSEIDAHLEELMDLAEKAAAAIAALKAFEQQLTGVTSKEIKNKIRSILNGLSELSGAELRDRILSIKDQYANELSEQQETLLQEAANQVDLHFDEVKEVIGFVTNLSKSEFRDFTLTQDQYYALKYILSEFIKLTRNQFDNHTGAAILEFLLENTILEYKNTGTDNLISEEKASLNDKGYLYVDIEALISAVDEYYDPQSRKSSMKSCLWFINPRPFFSIGVNYGYFPNSNSLSADANGNPATLNNFYFASEKIGLKIKLFDKRYTRSFAPGEKYTYKGKEWIWTRPMKVSTVSDMHLMVYSSGLLYNIIGIKSSENFNYAIAGAGIGLTFFNGLSCNLSLACPVTGKTLLKQNLFYNLGFDVPIIDYLSALRKKK